MVTKIPAIPGWSGIGALTGYTSIGNADAAGSFASASIAAFSCGAADCANAVAAHARPMIVPAIFIQSFLCTSGASAPSRERSERGPVRAEGAAPSRP
jgi:hypothetical protein